jgi:hypothetical protein
MPIKQLNIQAYAQHPIRANDIAKEEISAMQSAVGWELWLPFAAAELELSSDPKDYLIHPVPIMYSDLPNRNGFAFPLTELIKWNVELGCQAYKGWSGMPMYKEHKSDDHKKALGIVIDTSLRRIKNYGQGKFWKLMALAAVDRNKDPIIAEKMEKGEIDTYSMGAMVDYCTCSYCGAVAGECEHVEEKNDTVTFYEKNGRLVYKNVHGIKPYELSVVEDPAFATAQHTVRLTYDQGTIKAPNSLRDGNPRLELYR